MTQIRSKFSKNLCSRDKFFITRLMRGLLTSSPARVDGLFAKEARDIFNPM